MRFHTGLEEIERCGSCRVCCHFFASGVVYLWHVADEWHHVAQEFHQTAHTHALSGTYAEYWEDGACNEPLADAFAHLVFGESLFFEEFLHQCLVILGCRLHESLV